MTDKLREAAQQALEALDNMTDSQSNPARRNFPTIHDYGKSRRAADALRAALAQQDEQAVPQGWREFLKEIEWANSHYNADGDAESYCVCCDAWQSQGHKPDCKFIAMLNAAPTPPAQRVMLTDEEIIEMCDYQGVPDAQGECLVRAAIDAYERKNGIEAYENKNGINRG